jgi:hypothetical protein
LQIYRRQPEVWTELRSLQRPLRAAGTPNRTFFLLSRYVFGFLMRGFYFVLQEEKTKSWHGHEEHDEPDEHGVHDDRRERPLHLAIDSGRKSRRKKANTGQAL